MKKLLLSGLVLTFSLSTMAQSVTSQSQVQSRLNASVKAKSLPITKPSDTPILPVRAINSTVATNRSSFAETVIGGTVYDLQTNYGTMGNRVKLWDDGTVSVVWTRGTDDPGFTDRGTGYAYYDGSTWSGVPTNRLETIRTGWPNVSGTAFSDEIVVNHGTNPTNILNRTKGTGAWTENALGTTNMTWPRVVVGGANGNSVHVIGNENAGMYTTTYSRSLDGGATWINENDTLPNFYTYFFEGPVDAYDIDARGDVIAIAMGGFSESLVLWKSTDNGSTWTETIINEFPLAPYDYTTNISDVDGDGVADTIPTTDSGVALVIDNNNMVHVSVGSTRILDDDPTGAASYFPGTDGLLYWNESMPAGDITNNIIAFVDDIDGSGVIEIAPAIAIYQCGLTGMPSLGVDDLNNIHLVYSSIIENTTNGNPDPLGEESFRNTYYMYSTDAGMTWSTPVRNEPSDFDEMVWPNIPKKVTNMVHLTYHKDFEPGNTFQGDFIDPYGPYDVIYVGITNPVGLNDDINDLVADVNLFPNPVASVLNVDFIMNESQDINIQLVDVLGKVIYSTSVQAVSGNNNLKINAQDYASGVYSLNISNGSSVISNKVVIQ